MLNMVLDINATKARENAGPLAERRRCGVSGGFDDGGTPLAPEEDPPPLVPVPDPLGALQP